MNVQKTNRFRPQVESLERRNLMAANLTAGFFNGELGVEGTEGPDSIVVRLNANGLISVDGTPLAVPASQVKAIEIKSLGGNDNINVLGGNVLAVVDAGAGNDQVYGGLGVNLIYGGDGDDTLVGGPATDLIFGGAGNDYIFGYTGDDLISGQAGNDILLGWDGNDLIFGDDGADWLSGGNGVDILYGGGGADALLGDAGSDFLFYDIDDVNLLVSRVNSGQSATLETSNGNYFYCNGTSAQLAAAMNVQAYYRGLNATASSSDASALTSSPSTSTAFQKINKLYWTDQLDSGLSPYNDPEHPFGFGFRAS